MLQSKAGYIDARPLTANSAKPLATHGRTIQTGQNAKASSSTSGPVLPRDPTSRRACCIGSNGPAADLREPCPGAAGATVGHLSQLLVPVGLHGGSSTETPRRSAGYIHP